MSPYGSYNLNSLSPTEVEPPLLKFSKQPREYFSSLSYHSCAAAFTTGYGPRGDAFAVDHKWATSTLLIVTLKVILTLVQWLLLSTSYLLVR